MDLLNMGIFSEQVVIYGSVALFTVLIVVIYLIVQSRVSRRTFSKIEQAKKDGLHEPVSLHPVVDPNSCIQTGACISACPEKDILGIYKGKAMAINTSQCIGHGACFHACPTQAITLCIGTEKRGVDLPHVQPTFESNVPGLYIAGELGGMGLIKNAVEQGKQAVENMVRKSKQVKQPAAARVDETARLTQSEVQDNETSGKGIREEAQGNGTAGKGNDAAYDLVIVGAGPAGISASLAARKHGMKAITLDQDSLGGTVYTFPRSKIVMTSPMDLPLFGKVKMVETSKSELLDLWTKVIEQHSIELRERTRVSEIRPMNGSFETVTAEGKVLHSRYVLLAIGRRGTPRKLNIPGEDTEKVAYRLLEPELINGQRVIVVGGGDSAVEASLSLAASNQVLHSYRGEAFKRIKPKNRERISAAIEEGRIDMRFQSDLVAIGKEQAVLKEATGEVEMPVDKVYIFAGGELPTEFLKRSGVRIDRRFGEAVLKH